MLTKFPIMDNGTKESKISFSFVFLILFPTQEPFLRHINHTFGAESVHIGGDIDFCVMHFSSTSTVSNFSSLFIFVETRFVPTAPLVLRCMKAVNGAMKAFVKRRF